MKGKGNEVEDMFNASVGWVDLFKNWVQLHNVKITGEAASANKDTACLWGLKERENSSVCAVKYFERQ